MPLAKWPPKVGKTYNVSDSRKGNYTGKCVSASGEWATFIIVSGVAVFLTDDDRTVGDEVMARQQQCTLVLVS